jgi:hypothetical protein
MRWMDQFTYPGDWKRPKGLNLVDDDDDYLLLRKMLKVHFQFHIRLIQAKLYLPIIF